MLDFNKSRVLLRIKTEVRPDFSFTHPNPFNRVVGLALMTSNFPCKQITLAITVTASLG
jgi:hypothetical protein